MEFGLSEAQELLEQSVRRFCEAELPMALVRAYAAGEKPALEALWRGLCELGAAGALVPEEHGGSGLGMLEAAIISAVLGRSLAPLPWLGTAVIAPVALAQARDPRPTRRWLPRIASGKCRIGVAVNEDGDGSDVEAGGGGRLHGSVPLALDVDRADALLVLARRDGLPGLALVETAGTGVRLEHAPGLDPTRSFASLVLDGAEPLDWIGDADVASTALDAGRVALAADTLGACDRALELAVEYARQRIQFGRPVGSFQAVKHLCAEMAAELEPARALLWYAAHAFDAAPGDRSLLITHAKAHLAEVGSFVARTATEVHGGIGFTDEQNLHFWFKRIGANRQLLGAPHVLRERAAQLQGWARTEPR